MLFLTTLLFSKANHSGEMTQSVKCLLHKFRFPALIAGPGMVVQVQCETAPKNKESDKGRHPHTNKYTHLSYYSMLYKSWLTVKRHIWGAEETDRWLRALVAPAEDLDLAPSTYIATHNCL